MGRGRRSARRNEWSAREKRDREVEGKREETINNTGGKTERRM